MSDSKETTRRLCASGCGFYGCHENHGLCSNCYDDYLRRKTSIMLADLSLSLPKPEVVGEANQNWPLPTSSDVATSIGQDLQSQISHLPALSIPSSSNGTSRGPSRCTVCKKRVGLLGFHCQYCADVFCGSHRHTEDHCCSVDLKRNGRHALAEQNPVVKGDRIRFRV